MSLEGNIGLRYTKAKISGAGQIAYVNNESEEAAFFNPETLKLFKFKFILMKYKKEHMLFKIIGVKLIPQSDFILYLVIGIVYERMSIKM